MPTSPRTFLFASIPVPAHTSNPLPIAARLVERGHTVHWYAGRVFHDRIAAVGAQPLAYAAADDFGGREIEEHFPQFAGLDGVKVISRAFADVFIGQAAARVADLRPFLAATPVDAMLCDGLMYGVGMLSELTGVPWATFGDGPLPVADADTPPFGPAMLPMRGPVGRLRNRVVATIAQRVIFREAEAVYRRTRAELGLPRDPHPALDLVASPMLHLQGCTPGFEYRRRSLPRHVQWIGALRPDPVPGWVPPVWWPDVLAAGAEGRPVVHVTQGSIRPDMTELVGPAVAALGGPGFQHALVVVTTGGPSAAEVALAAGGELPANVRVAPFVPYDELLRHASAFVTNGGYSGVTLALAHGVPIVQAGTTEEKSEIGARIHWTGVGVRLRTTRPSPEQVARGVRAVLEDPRHRQAAQRVQAEMARHDAANEAADHLERLAGQAAARPGRRSVAERSGVGLGA